MREEADRLATRAISQAQQVARVRGRMMRRHFLAAKLFLGEDGQLGPHAVPWFAELARTGFVDETTFVAGDREQTLINEGRRQLALEILDSVNLDQGRLAALVRLEREEGAGT